MPDSTVTLVGNATRDPELRYTTGGKAVASFGLAVNKRFQRNGEWTEETSFFNVTCWDVLGENAAASVEKGSRVIVYGELKQREYEDREGQKRSVVEVNASAIGPDLRWATVTIERNERADRTDSKPADTQVYGDEEPF